MLFLLLLLFSNQQKTRCAARKRGERSDQPLTRRCAPGIRWRRAPVRCATPRGKETRDGKSANKAPLCSSVHVSPLGWMIILSALAVICLESETSGETAAPWSPDPRCKQLCQRLGCVRLRADYHLPPRLTSPIISQSITARLRQHARGDSIGRNGARSLCCYTVKMSNCDKECWVKKSLP